MLYQYFKVEPCKKCLTKQLLKLSIPNRINDPFEFHPQYIKIKNFETIKKQALKPNIAKMLTNCFNKDINFVSTFGDVDLSKWPDIVNCNLKNIYDFYADNFEASISSIFSNYIDGVSLEIGLLCFSRKYDSILMWSHYADNHTGIVLGFNEKFYRNQAIRVNYSDSRVPVEVGFEVIDKNQFEKVLYTKSTAWEYEDEYRICLKLDFSLKIEDDYFIPFPLEALEEVYFGVNCNEVNISAILSLLNKNVKIYKGKRNISGYQIDFIKMEQQNIC
jgi:hypothetical protein